MEKALQEKLLRILKKVPVHGQPAKAMQVAAIIARIKAS